jgi:ATP-dependent Clp protease ATP-binding subunit ClpC
MTSTDRDELDLTALRARKARLGAHIGKPGYRLLLISGITLIVAGILLAAIAQFTVGYSVVGVGLICCMLASWWRNDLHEPAVTGKGITDRLSGAALSRLPLDKPLTPLVVWDAMTTHWQTRFLVNRLLLDPAELAHAMSHDPLDLPAVWLNATRLADETDCRTIEPGHLSSALLLTSPAITALLKQHKLTSEDVEAVIAWLSRGIASLERPRPDFGGIGRDWANGFTPVLNRFGQNLSLAIERGGNHYDWLLHGRGVEAMKAAFSGGATAIGLIGETGVGKTSHVHALAQALLQESSDRSLEHHQIIALNASVILSSATRPGELEHLMLRLLSEAATAGNIILFFDDAQLFFNEGKGTFDASQLLLPVVQARSVRLIFAMTPHDFQSLKSKNNTFASQITPVMLTDPPEADVMHVLEDTALGLEHRRHILITYAALQEAYRLSGRYEQDIAYPGKAIVLLEQSAMHAIGQVVTPQSVQQAIEQTRGVKAGSAAPAESETLLHLEDAIHARMINQNRAVKVVAAALRRARAGVANPRRPIGSFLFLGPTGVGKTELAKAIAATYFGNETNMIRLDMSEYQGTGDVKRLLSSGQDDTASLIMSVRQQPFSVILLDEIEKAHPNVLNLLLRLLDEGTLTDTNGRAASFKDCIVIATSNAGAHAIRERVEQGEELETFEKIFIDELIASNQFKPELLNRFDEIVLFRPLKPEELAQVVQLMLNDINRTLEPQHITVKLTDAAIQKIVDAGYDARLGARPMRRTLQRAVEDTLAGKILRQEVRAGSNVTLDVKDLSL